MRLNKAAVGGSTADWRPGRDDQELQIKLPLEIDGEQMGDLLVLTAFPLERGKISFSLVHGVAVTRLDVTAHENHSNPFDALGSKRPTLIRGPHFHSWELNRRFVDSARGLPRLPMAEPYLGSVKVMHALRWFCGETKITLPHGDSFDLPSSGRLL